MDGDILTFNPNNNYGGGLLFRSASFGLGAGGTHEGPVQAGSLRTNQFLASTWTSATGDVTVDGAATTGATRVEGPLSAGGCRVCLFHGSPGRRYKHVCAHMAPGEGKTSSASLSLNGPVQGNTNWEMGYVCDGRVENSAGFDREGL